MYYRKCFVYCRPHNSVGFKRLDHKTWHVIKIAVASSIHTQIQARCFTNIEYIEDNKNSNINTDNKFWPEKKISNWNTSHRNFYQRNYNVILALG